MVMEPTEAERRETEHQEDRAEVKERREAEHQEDRAEAKAITQAHRIVIEETAIETADMIATEVGNQLGWWREEVRMTRLFLVLAIVTVFSFVALATYGAVHTVRSLRHEDCVTANARRREAKKVAVSHVDGDRAIWESFDELFIASGQEGLPEPTRTLIFESLDARQALIEVTFREEACAGVTVLP